MKGLVFGAKLAMRLVDGVSHLLYVDFGYHVEARHRALLGLGDWKNCAARLRLSRVGTRVAKGDGL